MENKNNNGAKTQKSIFKRRSFYITIAICIFAAAAILFWQMTYGNTNAQNQPSENVQNIKSPTLQEQLDMQKDEAQDDASGAVTITDPTPAPTADTAQDAKTEEAKEVPKNKQEAKISLSKPTEGEIKNPFEVEKLVYNPTLNMWQTHNGIDIVPGENTEIKAALSGEVTKATEDPTLGNVVVITHSGNLVTKYAGLSELKVKEGDKIEAGASLGICGTPPFEAHTGVHIHFEVWKNGSPVNPEEYFS